MTARSSPAALRNRDAIADVLASILPASGRALMVAEGSGEHAMHFAARFPHIDWLPTDPDPEALASIAAYRDLAALPNLMPPEQLDASAEDWHVEDIDIVICINMIHISQWAATEGLIRGAGTFLPPGGWLYLYGPYLRESVPTAPSNLTFDESLRARDPRWGLRNLDDVTALAGRHELAQQRIVEMPANNLSVLFRKLSGQAELIL